MAKSACTEPQMGLSVEKSHNSLSIISAEGIESHVFLIKGQKVMLDRDLAELYGTTTARLNEQVRRNIKRFPEDFMFSLTRQEILSISQIATSSSIKFSKNVNAFTEQGIAMLSSVLNSERAIQVNIAIMRAFVRIRQILFFNKELEQKLSELYHKVGQHDQDIISLFSAINKILKDESKPKGKFGFI